MLNTDLMNTYEWCDAEYEHDMSSHHNCVRLMEKFSKIDNVKSLCLRQTDCNDKLPYICQSYFFL